MKNPYKVVTVCGESAAIFHVVDSGAPEPEQPKIHSTHASRESAAADVAKLNRAQTQFIKALADFNGAAQALTEAWQQYEGATGEVVPNKHYPLPASFDDWALSLWEWADEVYSKLGEQP